MYSAMAVAAGLRQERSLANLIWWAKWRMASLWVK
jgi:hypothetical protein